MSNVNRFGLRVDARFAAFIEEEALPGTSVGSNEFWKGLDELAHKFGPQNAALLKKREEIQEKISEWHIARRGQPHDAAAYRALLEEIGYLVPEGPKFSIGTERIDPEISDVAGPQLVVPITNARFAINAANARWNSLYDALYGTDAIESSPPSGAYDQERGAKVVAWAKSFLDEIFALDGASHSEIVNYAINKQEGLIARTVDGKTVVLPKSERLVGFTGDVDADGHCSQPASILLSNNGLHLEIVIDRGHPIGSADLAGIADIQMESAVTTIMDCEDSVTVVDAEDKILAYSNWLGLMKGTLEAEVRKGGRSFTRKLASDRNYNRVDGTTLKLKGLSLLLVRNVGHLMTCPAVLDRDGNEIFEGLLDALCTVAIALHDVADRRSNSVAGSVYVVKPKMHGPEEVTYANAVFSAVERILGIEPYTVKLGIMDEERRTTVNLKECIRAAANRVAFINTGFLDRTGDEIHTSMKAGAFLRKEDIKAADWIAAYEDWNVDIGLACGLGGRAQIGKGMWAMPDLMRDMLEQKISHPEAGANTAWVPSPTAATLHAVHYHRVSAISRQREIADSGRKTDLSRILNIPLADGRNWSEDEIVKEVENNLQGILGYAVRWVDQGIGCSKVPDISNVQLMEDRATCRISSQHVANWLHHGIVEADAVEEALRRMAKIVDAQNEGDPNYTPMAPGFDGYAFNAARALVFEGCEQPSGYTEPILHRSRLSVKAASA